MIGKSWHICIIIPARNEEILLKRCLDSVLTACYHLSNQYTADIILAVDSSSDNTLKIGENFLANKGQVVTLFEGKVGSARKLATQVALNRYKGASNFCWIANTDADCKVPRTWLTDQLIEAHKGVQAIAGIIDVDSFAEHAPCVQRRFKKNYIIYPDNTHPHVHGANLGIRADLYQCVGGWNELTTAEDHDLWNRIIEKRVPVLSTSKLIVLTSGRRVGRSPNGFAKALASHNGYHYE